MVTSSRDRRPADVIALSPFRAELGRGRRLRRADALYDAPDLGGAVRALPGDELYYVLHEVGMREGADILAEATAEQLQVVLDFGIWERDQIDDEALDDWLEAIAAAPVERVGGWLAGIDSEVLGLVLRRRAHIYDLSQEAAPDEPEGTFFPTPDGLFVLDVRGGHASAAGEGIEPAAVVIRLVDIFYRTDAELARRVLVGARAELDAELEESAYRWRQGRMADLGFSDYYDALEVYRELDPAQVRVEPDSPSGPLRPVGPGPAAHEIAEDALRVPTALAERLRDIAGSPFARAAQKLGDGRVIEELRFALVALTNRVLAADRVAPGDDEAVAATLARMAATLDIAVERLAPGDDARGADVLRAVPLVRLFRLGFSLTARLRRLALALRSGGPLGRRGYALTEAEDAAVLEAVSRVRPMFPRLLDQPPAAGERPFASLADVARAAAGVERAAAAQALLHGLGVRDRDIAPGAPALAEAAADEAALDIGVFARTAIVRQLGDATRASATGFAPLDAREVAAFEAGLRSTPGGPPRLAPPIANRARAALETARPPSVTVAAAAAVIDRWLSSLAPLEPVLVRAAPVPPRAVARAKAPGRRKKVRPLVKKTKPPAKKRPAKKTKPPAKRKPTKSKKKSKNKTRATRRGPQRRK